MIVCRLRNAALASLSLFVLVGTTGCTYVPTRSMAYDPIDVSATSVRPGGIVAVRVLKDVRPERAYPSQLGSMFPTYIPLIPYVRIPHERLDASDEMTLARRGAGYMDEMSFPHLVMEAIADDLRDSRLFDLVVYVGAGQLPPDADFVLNGALRSTEFGVYSTSYGLGMAGVLFWFAPIPIGANAGSVEADLQLSDNEGNSIWSARLEGRRSKWFTLYNSGGAAISSRFSLEITKYGRNKEGIDPESSWAYHASAIRSGMEDVKSSLGAALAERDAGGTPD